MLVAVMNPRQLARQVGEHVVCDYDSTMPRATRLIAGAGGIALEGGVRFTDVVIITVSAFAPGQVLNFGSLAYVADCSGELHTLEETVSVGIESPASYPSSGLLGVDLEVLAR